MVMKNVNETGSLLTFYTNSSMLARQRIAKQEQRPLFVDIGVLIFDGVHDWSLDSDGLLGLAKEALRTRSHPPFGHVR